MRDCNLSIKNLYLEEKDGFSLEIPEIYLERGEAVGIIGANGSGKTSLLEAILRFRRIKRGEIEVLGRLTDQLDNECRSKLGVYLQTVNYESTFLVKEIVRLHRIAYYHEYSDLYDLLSIGELENKTFEHCSTGQKQRVGLYLALANNPGIAFLDEPTSALDSAAAAAFRSYIRKQRQSNPNLSYLIVTHDHNDADLVDRLIWLDSGRIIDEGDIDTLLSRYLGPRHLKFHNLNPKMKSLIVEKIETVRDTNSRVQIRIEEISIENSILHVFGTSDIEKPLIELVMEYVNCEYSVTDSSCQDLVAHGLNLE